MEKVNDNPNWYKASTIIYLISLNEIFEPFLKDKNKFKIMCGISGIFSSKKLEESDKALGRKILDELVHRGPDYKGEFESKNKKVFMGHNRLSIIFNKPGQSTNGNR